MTDEELDAPLADPRRLVEALSRSTDSVERYQLLHRLGRAGGPEYAGRVEPLLWSRDDPMLARLALQVLTIYWRLGTTYRDVVLDFIRGVEWDEEQDVRQIAISAAGRLLESSDDPELLRALIDAAEAGSTFEEDDPERVVADGALYALASAVGYVPPELPGVRTGIGAQSSLGRDILTKARARLAASPPGSAGEDA